MKLKDGKSVERDCQGIRFKKGLIHFLYRDAKTVAYREILFNGQKAEFFQWKKRR